MSLKSQKFLRKLSCRTYQSELELFSKAIQKVWSLMELKEAEK
jgi:hypothetical protein